MVLQYHAKLPDETVNLKEEKNGAHLLWLLIKGFAGVIIIYYLLTIALSWWLPYMPPSMEKMLGSAYQIKLRKETSNTPQQKHIQAILNQLTQHAPALTARYPFYVHVINANIVNALSYPQGHFVFYTGLLSHLHQDDDIAFVLAHELGHYAHHDHLRGLGNSMLLTLISNLVFGMDSNLGALTNNTLSFTALHFSRQQEFAADHYGVILMKRSGYNPQGAVHVLNVFETELPDNAPLLSTHPDASARLASLKKSF